MSTDTDKAEGTSTDMDKTEETKIKNNDISKETDINRLIEYRYMFELKLDEIETSISMIGGFINIILIIFSILVTIFMSSTFLDALFKRLNDNSNNCFVKICFGLIFLIVLIIVIIFIYLILTRFNKYYKVPENSAKKVTLRNKIRLIDERLEQLEKNNNN